jgi:hypothetical protein
MFETPTEMFGTVCANEGEANPKTAAPSKSFLSIITSIKKGGFLLPVFIRT